jgi:hypothetical protein
MAPSPEEEEDAMVAAADLLDAGSGPRFFTDFSKALLHPRSVLEVPFPEQGSLGFGSLQAGQVGTLIASS